jgi:hypothetical protein
MAEIINLRSVKKQAARVAARKKADENAARFGQTKTQRLLDKARTEKASQDLDAHRIEIK